MTSRDTFACEAALHQRACRPLKVYPAVRSIAVVWFASRIQVVEYSFNGSFDMTYSSVSSLGWAFRMPNRYMQ